MVRSVRVAVVAFIGIVISQIYASIPRNPIRGLKPRPADTRVRWKSIRPCFLLARPSGSVDAATRPYCLGGYFTQTAAYDFRRANFERPPGEFSTFNRIRRVNANGPLETNRTTRCSRTFVYNRFVHGNVTYINFGFLPPPLPIPAHVRYWLFVVWAPAVAGPREENTKKSTKQ